MAGSAGQGIKVVALEPDLFFAVKAQDLLKRAGYETRVTRAPAEFAALLRSGEYTVGLVDFAARGVDWRACVQDARAAGATVIVHGPHVDLDSQAEARAAGATRVIANSKIADLPALIGRVVARSVNGGAGDNLRDGEPPHDEDA